MPVQFGNNRTYITRLICYRINRRDKPRFMMFLPENIPLVIRFRPLRVEDRNNTSTPYLIDQYAKINLVPRTLPGLTSVLGLVIDMNLRYY